MPLRQADCLTGCNKQGVRKRKPEVVEIFRGCTGNSIAWAILGYTPSV